MTLAQPTWAQVRVKNADLGASRTTEEKLANQVTLNK